MKKDIPLNGTNIDGIMNEEDPMMLLTMRKAFKEVFDDDKDENSKEQSEVKE